MKKELELKEQVATLEGTTLEERAKLVLLTLGKTPGDVRRAYRRMVKRYHPDLASGDAAALQLVQESYLLLSGKRLPRQPLLARDEVLARAIGRRVVPLIDRQKEWDKYESWRKDHFYDAGVF
jgi:hypothetical protein